MNEDQINTLTQLLQKLVSEKQTHNIELPHRILRSIRDIANDMNMDYNSIPQKTLRGCGKFIRDEYIKHYGRRPLQMYNRSCLYTKKEIKFVQPLIKKYFEMNNSDSGSNSDQSNSDQNDSC